MNGKLPGEDECPLSQSFPHHLPGLLAGCTCPVTIEWLPGTGKTAGVLALMVRLLPEPERWDDGGPQAAPGHPGGHDHQYGPLCEAWATDWEDATPCDHGSCLWQVHEICEQCYAEAMDEATGVTPPMLRCGLHGDQLIVESGYNSGFNGEGVSWYTLACGDGEMQ